MSNNRSWWFVWTVGSFELEKWRIQLHIKDSCNFHDKNYFPHKQNLTLRLRLRFQDLSCIIQTLRLLHNRYSKSGITTSCHSNKWTPDCFLGMGKPFLCWSHLERGGKYIVHTGLGHRPHLLPLTFPSSVWVQIQEPERRRSRQIEENWTGCQIRTSWLHQLASFYRVRNSEACVFQLGFYLFIFFTFLAFGTSYVY